MIIDIDKIYFDTTRASEWTDYLTNCVLSRTWVNGWRDAITTLHREDDVYITEQITTHYPDGKVIPDLHLLRTAFIDPLDLVHSIFNPYFKEITITNNCPLEY